MDMWKNLSGMVEAELVSARLQWTLHQMNARGIELYQIQMPDLVTSRFWLRRKDWKQALAVCETAEGKLTLCGRKGLYWKLISLKNRKLLVTGMSILLALTIFLPSRIFFVQVDGNTQIPARRIIAAAETCGIRFGASRRAVRSEKVKNALLSALPQLQWAGVNTSGCVATISVRERTEQREAEEKAAVGSIVASRDGFLLSTTATRGNLLVHPGQSVQEGDILISGYTDCGISIRAEQAEGEILAQTIRKLEVQAPLNWTNLRADGRQWKKISLVLGKKRIFLWKDSGIPVASCGRMYREYVITLPGGFALPASICIETFMGETEEAAALQVSDYAQKLQSYGAAYVTAQMQAGQIMHTDTHMAANQDMCIFTAAYTCREMIGRLVQEQIGEANGENS